ncbi:uncharacterized protein LOC117318682 [Pecten maximus]|uniref:uncharacterized protein LOC117318682 n=1 Tax=Pecten maximus TaxID=6579 RepID=UPI001457FAFB|nr:uncharacterized protein LOC117318682 [Pecten maximus]
MVNCVVAGCTNRTGDNCSFFRFPKKAEFLKVWIKKINRVDERSGPASDNMWVPYPTSVICSDHFTYACFTRDPRAQLSCGFTDFKKLRLEKTAIPTLFPTKEKDGNTSPFTTPEPRPAFMKRERRRVLAEAFAEHDNKTASNQTVEGSNTEDQENIAAGDEPYASEEEHVHQFCDSTTQTVKTKQYVKGCQTTRTTVTQGTQTMPSMVSVGTMTDDVGTSSLSYHSKQWTSPCSPMTKCDIEGCIDDISADGSDDDTDDEWTPDRADADFDDSDDDLNVTLDDLDITDTEAGNPMLERKYIVFETNLKDLLSVCRTCGHFCRVFLKHHLGSLASFHCECDSGHVFKWDSQPSHRKLPLGNFVLAAGILFSGGSAQTVLNVLDRCNIACMTDRTYRNLQSSYLIPAVHNVWEDSLEQELQSLQGKNVKVGGDARYCSPGHTAKYSSYSLMDLDTGKILATELVQVTEVKNSCHMELEGLKRCLHSLRDSNVDITDLTTDRHIMVKSHMKKEEPDINHWFDVWHVAKGVYKKLVSLAKKKGCEQIGDWAHSISNHLYWAASTSDGDGDLVVQKWESITNHVCDKHEGHGDRFPTCQHAALDKSRNWILSGSKVHKELKMIVSNKYITKDIKLLSPREQTSQLESFHSLVCQFAPKSLHYFYDAMKARLLIAALHNNNNVNRGQAQRSDGTLKWKVSYPKAKKGGHCVKAVKEQCTYDYVTELVDEAFSLREAFPTYEQARKMKRENCPPLPATLANRVDVTEAVRSHKSRFNKRLTPSHTSSPLDT